jgi:hypothetical protein
MKTDAGCCVIFRRPTTFLLESIYRLKRKASSLISAYFSSYDSSFDELMKKIGYSNISQVYLMFNGCGHVEICTNKDR